MFRIICLTLLSFCFFTNVFADDAFEPNNDFSTASTITDGTHSLSGQDADFFKINLGTGSLQLVMTPSTCVDLNMILYNELEQVVAANFNSGVETIDYNVTIAGTYYIKVEPTSIQTTDYTLSIVSNSVVNPDDSYEPNNDFASASVITDGTYSLSGQDSDFFKIDLKSGSLQLVMTPSTSVDLNMTLYNDQEQVVAANFSSGTETIDYEVVLSGTYYIKVAPTSPLTITVTSPDPIFS